MKKSGCLLIGFLLFLLVFLIVYSFTSIVLKGLDEGVKTVKEAYVKPDTSITIHNGKPDTVITVKSVPQWLK